MVVRENEQNQRTRLLRLAKCHLSVRFLQSKGAVLQRLSRMSPCLATLKSDFSYCMISSRVQKIIATKYVRRKNLKKKHTKHTITMMIKKNIVASAL